jgi:hypothetical protein
MGLEKFSWEKYRDMLLTLKPILSQPGILPHKKGGRSSDHPHLRYTNKVKNTIQAVSKLIELQTPFISTKIWDLVYEKMKLTDPRSAWETEKFYNKIAKDLNSVKYVNFQSPLVHYDYRNLNKIKSVQAVRKFIRSPCPDNYENKILKIKNSLEQL